VPPCGPVTKGRQLDCGVTLDKKDWETPDDFFLMARIRWGPFDLDAAAAPWNAKCERYYSLWACSPRSGATLKCDYEDSLALPWEGHVWCNPPYGRGLDAWVRYGALWGLRGSKVTMLLPARVSTRWFHENCLQPGVGVYFVKGRLTFKGAASAAPFPSMVVVFGDPELVYRTTPTVETIAARYPEVVR